MMKTFACIVALLLVPVASAAQSIPTVLRCAAGGAHLEGCTLSAPTCRFADFVTYGACDVTPEPGTVTEPIVPPPPPPTEPVAPSTEPTPDPVAVDPSAPTNLRSGVHFDHAAGADWYTLRINGAYVAHVASWARYIPLDEATLPTGATYAITVDACTDLGGCVRSAPLLIVR